MRNTHPFALPGFRASHDTNFPTLTPRVPRPALPKTTKEMRERGLYIGLGGLTAKEFEEWAAQNRAAERQLNAVYARAREARNKP